MRPSLSLSRDGVGSLGVGVDEAISTSRLKLAIAVTNPLDPPPGGGAGGLTGGDFHSIIVDPTNLDWLFVGGHTAVSASTGGGATWAELDALHDADAEVFFKLDDQPEVTRRPSPDGMVEWQPDELLSSGRHLLGVAYVADDGSVWCLGIPVVIE